MNPLGNNNFWESREMSIVVFTKEKENLSMSQLFEAVRELG